MRHRSIAASRALALISTIVLGALGSASSAHAAPTVAFTHDLSNTPAGWWLPPPSSRTRGRLWVEHPIQVDGSTGPVLSTLGVMGGERVVFPVTIDGTQQSLRYDVDFQRMVPLIDSAMMWHVNV